MKTEIVTLARPAMVHDEMRYPIEGSLTVSPAEAERLKLAGVLTDGDDGAGGDDELENMKLADLHILVTKEGVALHDAKKKDDIVAAIRKHRAGGSGPDYERDSLKDLDLAQASKDQLLVIAAYEQANVPQGDAATEADLIEAITTHREA